MNITSQYTIPTIYSRKSKFNMTNTADRDAQVQRALLGDISYITPSSPLNTPSPSFDGLSPLSVASHLQDASDAPFQVRDINPFLDASWRNEADFDQPVRLVPSASPKRKSRSVSVSVTSEPSVVTLLPTIQETVPSQRSSAPPVPKRKQNTMVNATYSLPPSALGITTSSPFSSGPSNSSGVTQIRRRPSPFPLGPLPPPPPPRRTRYEPRPHVVDLATEQLNLKAISSTPSTSSVSSNPSSTSALQQERERQWKLWDEERLRSLEMTREAAKNNRVITSRAHPTYMTTTTTVQEKSTTIPKPSSPTSSSTASKSSVKRRWWCFGSSATESDVEDSSHNEKHVTVSRSNSHLSTASGVGSVESEEEEEDDDDNDNDDEDEWDEARTAGSSGLIRFGCARKRQQQRQQRQQGEIRPRATLKKRAI